MLTMVPAAVGLLGGLRGGGGLLGFRPGRRDNGAFRLKQLGWAAVLGAPAPPFSLHSSRLLTLPVGDTGSPQQVWP